MQVVLLEKVEKLGELGEVVSVKPGYARNFLIPQQKALRATDDNLAYFEAEKAKIEALNAKKRDEASKLAKKIDGEKVILIRQASEGGQLYGSVSSRDIADAIAANGTELKRSQIDLNQAIKTVGLFDIDVTLHAEVKVAVTVNIARSPEEAETQEKTGKAVILNEEEKPVVSEEKADEAAEAAKEELLEDSALKAEQAAAQAAAEAAAEEAEKEADKAAKAAEKAQAEADTETSEETAEAVAETEAEETK